MIEDKSLICAYLLDGVGGGKPLNWQAIHQWTPEQGLLWVHLNYASKKTIQWIRKNNRLDLATQQAMLMEEVRPRTLIKPNGLLIFLRGVNLNPGQDPEDMVSIRIWIDDHCIITTRRRRLLSIADIRSAIDLGDGPKSSSEFLKMLNDYLLSRIADLVESIDMQVDELEEAVITDESRLLRPKIADIRRQTIMIRRYLSPQREALNKLHYEPTPFLSATVKLQLQEDNDRLKRYIEDLESAREKASITQEELSSRISEQLDKRMYLLSLVAVIFLPLSFITGLLGINVGGIPGSEDSWGFWWVCSLLSISLVGMLWYLYRHKWI